MSTQDQIKNLEQKIGEADLQIRVVASKLRRNYDDLSEFKTKGALMLHEKTCLEMKLAGEVTFRATRKRKSIKVEPLSEQATGKSTWIAPYPNFRIAHIMTDITLASYMRAGTEDTEYMLAMVEKIVDGLNDGTIISGSIALEDWIYFSFKLSQRKGIHVDDNCTLRYPISPFGNLIRSIEDNINRGSMWNINLVFSSKVR